MTDIVIPVTTIWDVIGNALDDVWFWVISVGGMFITAYMIRSRFERGRY